MALSFRHQKVQRLRRLLRNRALRMEQGRFVIEGRKLLQEAVKAGVEIESVFVADGYSDSMITEIVAKGVRVFELEQSTLDRVADTVHPQEVLAVVSTVNRSMEDVLPASFLVVGVDVRDPGNAGTILRGAAAAGADAVVFTGNSVDPHNPKTVRASAGAIFHVGVVVNSDVDSVFDSLEGSEAKLVGAVVDGGAPHVDLDLGGPVALVVGNEADGLPEPVTRRMNTLATIPMARETESLNVGMATTVLCFEVARQRMAS